MPALNFRRKRKRIPYFRPVFHLKLIALAILLGVLAAGLEALFTKKEKPVVYPSDQESRPHGSIQGVTTGGSQSKADASPPSSEPKDAAFVDRKAEIPRLGDTAAGGQQNSAELINRQSRVPAEELPEQISLSGVEDNRRVVPSEWEAWLKLFALLDAASYTEVITRAITPVSYLQLMGQPHVYRGRLVKTSGTVRRAHRVRPPKNPWGLDHYHQLWLQVDDHPADPVAVWAIDLPAEFPLGMTIEERAEVVGYFFKITTYVAADGKVRRAPLILAKTISWNQRPPIVQPDPRQALPYILSAAAGLAALATFWVWWRTKRSGHAQSEKGRPVFVYTDADEAPSPNRGHLASPASGSTCG
ncbi:MAG: hypothetical protein NZ899_12975 [Thermoguttaceae bacterium]|nr:hypothetical protein [Thermoguttaceae bacterium]MDW8079983.1 hypothetical protein [Thermoguttaceae bacterium]